MWFLKAGQLSLAKKSNLRVSSEEKTALMDDESTSYVVSLWAAVPGLVLKGLGVACDDEREMGEFPQRTG